MSSRAYHYTKAEDLLEQIANDRGDWSSTLPADALERAHVHALLANVDKEVADEANDPPY